MAQDPPGSLQGLPGYYLRLSAGQQPAADDRHQWQADQGGEQVQDREVAEGDGQAAAGPGHTGGGEIPSPPAGWPGWPEWAADHWPSCTDS